MSATAFQHKTRKMIFNHISSHPGVTFGKIKRIFDMKDGTLRYHLNYLETKKIIISFNKGNRKYYYPNEKRVFSPKYESDFKIHKLSDTQDWILDTIQRYPGISQKELMLRTGLKRLTVVYNLKKLLDFKIIRKVKNGKFTCYQYISDEELRNKIMKSLIVQFLNYDIDEKTLLELKRKLEY
ncbi:winged helix-turn-helix transcriptional regulator [[Eubacterium] cellulosolvens]